MLGEVDENNNSNRFILIQIVEARHKIKILISMIPTKLDSQNRHLKMSKREQQLQTHYLQRQNRLNLNKQESMQY